MKIPKLNKRGQLTGGIINGAIALIILVVVGLIVISTIINANLLKGGVPTTIVANETMSINGTGTQLANWNENFHDFTIIQIRNDTVGFLITNYTLDASGILRNSTISTYTSANVSYSYLTNNPYEDSIVGMKYNLTGGIQNVSTKIPTILLMAAVVLLFGVLVFLVAKAKEMGSISGTGGSL